MKRPTRSKDLARKRALIRSLIEQSPLAVEADTPPSQRRLAANIEYLWGAEGAADEEPSDRQIPANIIPFPNLRGKAGT